MRHKKVKLIAVIVLGLGLTAIHAQTVKDIDGNVYKTVTIGTQTWMAKNLKVTHYRNSDPIPYVTDKTAWSNQITPGYCWYNNDEATYKKTYGALYNWYIVNTGNLCPSGWHVPTDAEWTTLTNFLGNENIAYNKLKEKGTAHWNSANTGETNEFGFTALPGGHCYYDGNFSFIGYRGYWWSSTEYGTDGAWSRSMSINAGSNTVYRGKYNRQCGFSVRCVMD